MRVRKLGSGNLFEVEKDLCNPVEAGEPNLLQSEATVLGAGEAQQPGGDIDEAQRTRRKVGG